MISRDLYPVAESTRARLRETALSKSGCEFVDVETLAEDLGLRIVGSDPSGRYRLPFRKRGQLRVERHELIVRSDLFERDAMDVEFREVIAHELSHYVLHEHFLQQRPLPFGRMDAKRLELARFAFSREQSDQIEREAIFMAALIQVPVNRLKLVLRSHIDSYCFGKWTLVTTGVELAESNAARIYSRRAINTTMSTFGVTRSTAKVALGYWKALSRPPYEWLREAREARLTSLR